MRISESWLREWVDPGCDCHELAMKLTMAGLEVDGIDVLDNDQMLAIDLTPNRGDCLSIAGIAREVAAFSNSSINPVAIEPAAVTIDDQRNVTLKAPDYCSRYIGRVIRGVDNSRATPQWLTHRLQAAGINTISPLVDIANYVMLELGQPMHAFDLNCLQGNITVRTAVAGEKITLLDGQTVSMDEKSLVIADDEHAVALAGIMGSADSGVSAETVDLFLESIFFDPIKIGLTARRYGIHSDSCYRFQRGVDPALQQQAMERATALILEIVGGEVGPPIEAKDSKLLPQPQTIILRPQRVRRILGMEISDETMVALLERLNMALTPIAEGWSVLPPSYRFDIVIEEDLIEEIARLTGYDNLAVNPVAQVTVSPKTPSTLLNERVGELLADLGYHEAITYSFVDSKVQTLFNPQQPQVALVNPVTVEMDVMRTTLWPGLIKAALYNLNRQQSRLRLFEIGRRFSAESEQMVVSGLVLGSVLPEQWGSKVRQADFYDVKGDLEQLFALGGQPEKFTFIASTHPALHPGQCARICCADAEVGYLGRINPDIAAQLDLPKEVFLFELLLSQITAVEVPRFQPLSKFPSIRRDLAFLIKSEVTAAQMAETVHQLEEQICQQFGDLSIKLHIFDVYQGKNVEIGQKSVALGLILQHTSRTLIDKEVESIIQCVVDAMQRHYDAVLRA